MNNKENNKNLEINDLNNNLLLDNIYIMKLN